MSFNLPALPGADAAPAPVVSDAVYAVAANNAAAVAAEAAASAPAAEPKKRKRAASATNTSVAAGTDNGKFVLPDTLTHRIEQINAVNPNDPRVVFVRGLQATGVAFATIDNLLGHEVGAAVNYVGMLTEPSTGANNLYSMVCVALARLFSNGILPLKETEKHRALISMAMELDRLSSSLIESSNDEQAMLHAAASTPVGAQVAPAARAALPHELGALPIGNASVPVHPGQMAHHQPVPVQPAAPVMSPAEIAQYTAWMNAQNQQPVVAPQQPQFHPHGVPAAHGAPYGTHPGAPVLQPQFQGQFPGQQVHLAQQPTGQLMYGGLPVQTDFAAWAASQAGQ